MSRHIPRRRQRDRASRRVVAARSVAPATEPAFVEDDDHETHLETHREPHREPHPPVHRGHVGSADRTTSMTPVVGTSLPAEAPSSSLAPARRGPRVAVDVAVVEEVDPDLPVLSAATELSRQAAERPRSIGERHRSLFVLGWVGAVLAGTACLLLAMAGTGPSYLDDVGAVVVLSSYSWALAARTGGRPLVFGTVALVASVGVLASEQPYLRTGAAVMMCALAATLAVVVTVPAVRFVTVARECLVAVVVAGIGALATLGFAPTISLVRFEYATLALALLAVFAVVYRLGAGLHGLGRRGVVVVLLGAGVLLGTLLYAEMLRRYGPPEMVDGLVDGVRWSRDRLGAFPRPLVAVLGVPALAWGVHMRARRRQGWWVCAFGAAGTVAVANSLLNPAITVRECGLSVLYGLVVGLVLGYAVIRLEQAFAGTGSGGRRSEEHAAARPEPSRTSSLL